MPVVNSLGESRTFDPATSALGLNCGGSPIRWYFFGPTALYAVIYLNNCGFRAFDSFLSAAFSGIVWARRCLWTIAQRPDSTCTPHRSVLPRGFLQCVARDITVCSMGFPSGSPIVLRYFKILPSRDPEPSSVRRAANGPLGFDKKACQEEGLSTHRAVTDLSARTIHQ
jgi:hypothetical protein